MATPDCSICPSLGPGGWPMAEIQGGMSSPQLQSCASVDGLRLYTAALGAHAAESLPIIQSPDLSSVCMDIQSAFFEMVLGPIVQQPQCRQEARPGPMEMSELGQLQIAEIEASLRCAVGGLQEGSIDTPMVPTNNNTALLQRPDNTNRAKYINSGSDDILSSVTTASCLRGQAGWSDAVATTTTSASGDSCPPRQFHRRVFLSPNSSSNGPGFPGSCQPSPPIQSSLLQCRTTSIMSSSLVTDGADAYANCYINHASTPTTETIRLLSRSTSPSEQQQQQQPETQAPVANTTLGCEWLDNTYTLHAAAHEVSESRSLPWPCICSSCQAAANIKTAAGSGSNEALHIGDPLPRTNVRLGRSVSQARGRRDGGVRKKTCLRSKSLAAPTAVMAATDSVSGLPSNRLRRSSAPSNLYCRCANSG